MKSLVRVLVYCLMIMAMALFAGCSSQEQKAAVENGKQHIITDSLGRKVKINYPIKRAVVSNAYNAELITAIGAIDRVVGVDYHIYQDQEGFGHRFTKEMVIGNDQRSLNYEKIIELRPQVVIMTSNGGWEEAAKKLAPFDIAVVNVDAYYTDKFKENALLMGEIFGEKAKAQEYINYFSSKLDYINKQLQGVPKKRLYFEYRAPGKTTIPGDYFFNMVEYAGADNIFKTAKNTSVDIESVVEKNPEYIVKVSDVNVYSSFKPPSVEEHKRIKEKLIARPGWEHIKAVEKDNILLLSHYAHGGASKLVGTMYIAKFLYPEQLPELHPEQVFKDWVTKYQKLEYKEGHTYPKRSLAD